jgi:surface protein
MFDNCRKLINLDVSNFDTSSVTNMTYMFGLCEALANLDLSGFDTSQVTDMSNMFYSMPKLQEVTLGANFSFAGNGSTSCTLPTPYSASEAIPGADGNWYTEDGTAYAPANVPSNTAATYYAVLPPTMASGSTWYKGTTAKNIITQIDIVSSYTPTGTVTESWNADAADSGSIKCYVEGTKLTIAGNGAIIIKSNANSSLMFSSFPALRSFTGLNILDTSETTSMSDMFMSCGATNFTSLDLSNFDTSNVTNMKGMFQMCQATSLDLRNFDTSNVTNMNYMFTNAHRLQQITLGANFSFTGNGSASCTLPTSTWYTNGVQVNPTTHTRTGPTTYTTTL